MIIKTYKFFVNKISGFFKLFYRAAYDTVMHDGIEQAGYLAFLALLSFFPFIVLLITIAGNLGREEYGARFISDFLLLLPENVAHTIKPTIDALLSGPPQSLLTIAIIGLLWTSSSAVEGIRNVLNKAYIVTNPPSYILRRLTSILQIVVITFLVLIAMFFITIAPNIMEFLQLKLSLRLEYNPHLGKIRYSISSIIMFLSIAFSYYAIPNIKQSFIRVIPGTVMVFILWLLFAYIFSSYISYYQRFNFIYGSLASIILTLLFFYILGLIYIFGAEFNYHCEVALGHKIVPKE